MLVCSVNVFGQLKSVKIDKNVTDKFELKLTAIPNGVNEKECTYKWNNNKTTQVITINESGEYKVTVTNDKDNKDANIRCEKLERNAITIKKEVDGSKIIYLCEYDSTIYIVDKVSWIKDGEEPSESKTFEVDANASGNLQCSVQGFGKIDTIIELTPCQINETKNDEEDFDESKLENSLKGMETSLDQLKTFVFIGGIILAVLLVLLYVIVFVSKKNREKNIIKAIRDCEDSDFKRKIVAVVMENQKFKEMLRSEFAKSAGNQKSYDGDINDLKRRIATLEDKNRGSQSTMQQQSTVGGSVSIQKPEPIVKMYAESINDKKFSKVKDVPNEDTIFELRVKGNTATVTIYEPAYQKILANPSFLEGCSKQMLGRSSVTVTEEGRAENDAGKWIVTVPVKVVLK